MPGDFQEKLDRNLHLLDTANAPGGIMVYYADGDEEIIHVNQYVIDLCGCDKNFDHP